MAYDVLDPIPLAITVRNAANVPENATAVVLTITLPDQTIVTPAVTGVAGVYTTNVPYLAPQPGRYVVSWVATGTNACTSADIFNVLPADPHFIISLAEARNAIGIAAANTAKDEDLRAYIYAATPIMEDICGPILRTSVVETFDGGSDQINLLWWPLISVTSIVESYGSNYVRTLTLQDIFAVTAVDAFGYTVELKTGLVTRRVTGTASPFPRGRRNVQVAYVPGREVIGGNITLGTRRLVKFLWQQDQQGYRPSMGAPDTAMTTTPSGFAVPRAVIELCAGDVRGPGIA